MQKTMTASFLISTKANKRYVEEGIIQGGMIPKLENSFEAIHAGVSKVIITLATAIDGVSGTVIER